MILSAPIKLQEDLFIAKHCKDRFTNFYFAVNNGDKRLPLIYWLPKFYKKSTKAIFVIAALVSSTKLLPKSWTSVFKLFFKEIFSWH